MQVTPAGRVRVSAFISAPTLVYSISEGPESRTRSAASSSSPSYDARARHGLGLAIARRIVELHGGAIGVENAEGGAATFTVRLPMTTLPNRRAARIPTNGSRKT